MTSQAPHSRQDKIRKTLRRLLKEHGVDMATISRAIGKNHAYIQQYLTRGIPAELSYSTALALAQYFSISADNFGIHTPANFSQTLQAPHPIQTLRSTLGLNINAFASALNMPPELITDIETGKTTLNETQLFRICQTFRISPDDLRQFVPQFTEAERNIIYRLRRISPQQLKMLEEMLKQMDGNTSPFEAPQAARAESY